MDNHISNFISTSREFLSADRDEQQSPKENHTVGESIGDMPKEGRALESPRILFQV